MLIDSLNQCIIDMKEVMDLETVSADTKKQANADYNLKQLVLKLQKIVREISLAVDNSDFRPSINIVSSLKSFISSCDRIMQADTANKATNEYISERIKKLDEDLGKEWSKYYSEVTDDILNLLGTIKSILFDENKAVYAINKIKKAASWNHSVDNYNYLNQGLKEAEQILNDLDLDKNSSILTFLKLISDGNATIKDLTDEILAWIEKENLADKMQIKLI